MSNVLNPLLIRRKGRGKSVRHLFSIFTTKRNLSLVNGGEMVTQSHTKGEASFVRSIYDGPSQPFLVAQACNHTKLGSQGSSPNNLDPNGERYVRNGFACQYCTLSCMVTSSNSLAGIMVRGSQNESKSKSRSR